MFDRRSPALLLAMLGMCAGQIEAAELTPAEIEGARKVDAFTIPTPGELFAAINKESKPTWQSFYRPPIPTAYSSRAQIALNLGGLIADGYIAVQAEDGQQVKNVGKDITTLAKALGVSENVIRRGSSIADFAEHNEWSALKEELDATQNEVKLAMEEMRDESLIILVSLGGWIRGTEVVSSYVAANYNPNTAKLLRQPAIVQFLRTKTEQLPEKTRNDRIVESVREKLGEIERLVSFPKDQAPPLENVQRLKAVAAELGAQISSKQ